MTNLCKLNEILYDHVIKSSWCRIYLSFFKIILLTFILFSCQMPIDIPEHIDHYDTQNDQTSDIVKVPFPEIWYIKNLRE